MPKTASTSTPSHKSSLLVYKTNHKRVLARRTTCYKDAIRDCRKLFSDISAGQKITFHTKELDICSGLFTEISEDVWGEVIGNLTSVTVMTEELIQKEVAVVVEDVKRLTVKVVFANIPGGSFLFRALPEDKLELIVRAAENRFGTEPRSWNMVFDGRRCLGDQTLDEVGIEDGDTLFFHQVLIGGKPVIYIFSPETREAEVKLSLIAQWNLCAIYPVVPIKPRTACSNEQVAWSVRTHANGDLTELTTGLDVAYLFWEAHTDATVPASRPLSLRPGELSQDVVEHFNPNEAVLNDENSVVMPVAKVTPYLDQALAALGLHTEARTSFITYWLPSMLKHQHLAIRFVPQASYEQAAPLEISPPPDVITRVFMIFQGVAEEKLQGWTAASCRASEDVAYWRKVVGVDLERALDTNLFRVLEWGGMEVHLRP